MVSPLHEHGPLTCVIPGEPPPPDPPLPPAPPAGGTVINTTVDVGASVSVGASVAVLARVGDAVAVGELVKVTVESKPAVCARDSVLGSAGGGGGAVEPRNTRYSALNEQQKNIIPDSDIFSVLFRRLTFGICPPIHPSYALPLTLFGTRRGS